MRATTAIETTETIRDPAEHAARPPRDLTVDALRALAICAVAVGHWLVVVPSFADGRFGGVNALETVPAMRGLTWVFQVMPLFFVVGGCANVHSWRSGRARGVTYHEWLRTRLVRLLRPSAAFVGVWVVVGAALRSVGIDPEVVRLVAWLAVVPVWFLAVYVLVVAAAPPLLWLHGRFGLRVLIVLAALATAVDAVRLGTAIDGVEWTNFFWVFLFAQQVGFFWSDGSLVRRRWVPASMFLGGLALLVALTGFGPYPLSLVGVPGEAIANNAPPTITLIALGIAQTGLALLLRARIARALERPMVLRSVVGLNRNAMTVLLWHFTALIIASAVILPTGAVPSFADGSVSWWFGRVLAVLVLCGPLAALVAVFGRAERGRARPPARSATDRSATRRPAVRPSAPSAVARSTAAMVIAAVASAASFGLIAVGGLNSGDQWLGFPRVPVLLLVVAVALTSVGSRPTSLVVRTRDAGIPPG